MMTSILRGRRTGDSGNASTLLQDRAEFERRRREIDEAMAVTRAQVAAYQHRRPEQRQ